MDVTRVVLRSLRPGVYAFILFTPVVSAQDHDASPVIDQAIYRYGEEYSFEREYYPNSRNLLWVERFQYGKLLERLYLYRTGEPMLFQEFEQDRQTGVERWYWRNGKEMHRFPYRNGYAHGISYSFDSSGNLTDSTLYLEGKKARFELYREHFGEEWEAE